MVLPSSSSVAPSSTSAPPRRRADRRGVPRAVAHRESGGGRDERHGPAAHSPDVTLTFECSQVTSYGIERDAELLGQRRGDQALIGVQASEQEFVTDIRVV